MNFIRKLLIKRNQFKGFKNFHETNVAEIMSTNLASFVNQLSLYRWTPNLYSVPYSLKFLEYLEDCLYQKEFDIFDKDCKRQYLFELIQQFIIEAFEKEEFEQLEFQKDIQFDITHRSPFHGKIDMIIQNKCNNNVVILMVPKQQNYQDIYQGYFRLNKYTGMSVIHYFLNSYEEVENINLIQTNGICWQMYNFENQVLKRTQCIYYINQDRKIDTSMINLILGMIRYPLIRSESEVFLDKLQEKKFTSRYYQNQNFLQK